MLSRRAIVLLTFAVSSRPFSTIKFDLSHRHFSAPQPPAAFSHSKTASKLSSLYQPCINSHVARSAVSFTRSLSPIIKSIASNRFKPGNAALIELPCAPAILNSITEFEYKLSIVGTAPHWSVDASDILKAAGPSTSLIALRTVNPANGAVRSPDFFASLLRALQLQNPSRQTMIIVDDTFLAPSVYFSRDGDSNIAFIADIGASIGAPDHCCAVLSPDSTIHHEAQGHPLQASCASIVDRLSSSASRVNAVLLPNTAVFHTWIQRESSRLICSAPPSLAGFSRCLVSLAPGIELDPRRFYSELERRGCTRVGRGSEWCVDDSSFMVEWGHVSSDTLHSGLQAISSALDVWATTNDSSLGLSSIY
jgi:hypothetical protein